MKAIRGNPPSVLIRGDGIAAACCAHLLKRAGVPVRIERQGRARIPAVLLSEPALALIRDVFDRPSLLADLPRVDRRIVAWGADPVAMPHAAAVVSEEALLEALSFDAQSCDGPESDAAADFVIHTAAPPTAGMRRFGSRSAVALEVRLKDPADQCGCWMESLDQGWLFLVPNARGSTWLLAVGAVPERLLEQSRLIAPRVELAGPRSGAFDACPRILSPACGDDWLACGTAAVAFDPICGDGAAQAVREAILASAVIVAIAEGGDAPALLSHYAAMLTAAMRRHLVLCAEFYRTGGSGPWWSQELEALAEGHGWCTAQLAVAPEPAYRLDGFRLMARELVHVG